ncbi:MAG: MATE family efflux transporter [Lachnospiraceae bacterium]|nr:MATE family efflux transporter [Lachnospiraceae bacterium]
MADEKVPKRKSLVEMDLCSGSIAGKMLLFALPLMLSNVLQLLFNAADLIVVGRACGEAAIAAVGSNGSMINLMTNLFMGLSVGVNVLASHYYGAGDHERLSKTVHTSILLAAFSGLVLTIIGEIGAKQILIWMSTPEEVLPLAVIYLRIYFLGMIPMMIYNFGSALLRSIGDTLRPLVYLGVSGAINLGLNLLFVLVFHMGVDGVGYATVISQVISGGAVLVTLMLERSDMHLSIRKLRFDKNILGKIISVGIPAGLQGVVFSLSNVVIQSSVNSFDTLVVTGNTAAQNIEGFAYVGMNCFYHAALSFTGQNLGAGRYDRIKKIVAVGQLYVFLAGFLLGNGMYLLSPSLLSFYTDNPVSIEAGQVRLMIIGCSYFLCGMMDVTVGCLRGLGRSVLPTIISLVGACGLRIIWLLTLFRIPAFHTTTMIYITYPISWTVTLSAQFILFLYTYNKLIKKAR